MDLFVHTDQQHGGPVMHLAGSLTGGTLSILDAALVELLSVGTPRIVVELSGVTCCDDAGVGLIAGAAAVAAGRGGEIRLAAPSPAVLARLRAGDLTAQMATFVSVPGAIRADQLELVSAPETPPRSWAVPVAHALAATRPSVRHGQGRTRTNRPPFRSGG